MTVNNELCLKLIHADHDEEVLQILQDAGYWENDEVWRPLGDNYSNASVVHNQQGSPLGAFVEKLTNSVDAILIGECRRAGIDPESNQAPSSMREAIAQFIQGRDAQEIGPDDGLLVNFESKGVDITEIAKRIYVVATGYQPPSSGSNAPAEKQKSHVMTLSVVDMGEGQSPSNFGETFMTLTGSNKNTVRFTQGQWGMGGTGALPYCSDPNRFQILVSRRHPELLDSDALEEDKNWGFSVIRLRKPRENEKIPVYEYLCPGYVRDENLGQVLECDLETLPLQPTESGVDKAFDTEVSHGTLMKLIDYHFKGSQVGTSSILLSSGLMTSIDTAFPNAVLPFRLFEGRHYRSASNAVNVTGVLSRLALSAAEGTLEEGFPLSWELDVSGQPVSVKVIVFKPAKGIQDCQKQTDRKRYMNFPLIYSVNGQEHSHEKAGFFNRKPLQSSMAYVKHTLGIVVDLSSISPDARDQIFMASRDRMRESAFKEDLQSILLRNIDEDQTLRDLNRKRGKEFATSKATDPAGANEVLKKLLRSGDNRLSELLATGGVLKSALGDGDSFVGEEEYDGKPHPSFFHFEKNKTTKLSREAEAGRRSRIPFLTDAENGYFTRPSYPGKRSVKEVNGHIQSGSWGSLHNGQVEYVLEPFDEDQVDKKFNYEFEITDETMMKPLSCSLELVIVPKRNTPSGESPPPPPRKGPKLQMPDIKKGSHDDSYEDKEDSAVTYFDSWNDKTALIYIPDPDNPVFFYNVDNKYLLSEKFASANRKDPEVTENQFSLGLALLSLVLVEDLQDGEEEVDLPAEVKKYSEAIAPALIPLIDALSTIEPMLEGEE